MRFVFLLITLPLLQAANAPLGCDSDIEQTISATCGGPTIDLAKNRYQRKGNVGLSLQRERRRRTVPRIRDFSQQADLVWSPALHEQQATIRVPYGTMARKLPREQTFRSESSRV